MTWAARLARLNASQLDYETGLSVPVLLPGGDVVPGIFHPTGAPAGSPWPVPGLAVRIDQQPNPWVALADAAATDLTIGDEVTIDGAAYRVTATPKSDGTGLTPVELAAAREGSPLPDGTRWR